MKPLYLDYILSLSWVAPSRGRGLKHIVGQQDFFATSRPFTGAWIETPVYTSLDIKGFVAPSRGRGLKPFGTSRGRRLICRPFTGAWIETYSKSYLSEVIRVAPSRGRGLKPTIETKSDINKSVAPSRGRGLKLATPHYITCPAVAPSRGRGLKQHLTVENKIISQSPLHGGVD